MPSTRIGPPPGSQKIRDENYLRGWGTMHRSFPLLNVFRALPKKDVNNSHRPIGTIQEGGTIGGGCVTYPEDMMYRLRRI